MNMTTIASEHRRRSFIDQIVDNLKSQDKSRWSKINEDTTGMYDKGVKYAKKGDFDSAEICFTKALNARTFVGGVSDMGVVVAHIKLATVLERKGSISCAEAHYTAALRALKSNKDSLETERDENLMKFLESTESYILERLCNLPWADNVINSNIHSNCTLCSRVSMRCRPCRSSSIVNFS